MMTALRAIAGPAMPPRVTAQHDVIAGSTAAVELLPMICLSAIPTTRQPRQPSPPAPWPVKLPVTFLAARMQPRVTEGGNQLAVGTPTRQTPSWPARLPPLPRPEDRGILMQPQYLSVTACDSKTFDAKQPTKIDTELASVRVVVDGRRTSVVGPLHAFADWSQAQKCKQEMRRRAHACLLSSVRSQSRGGSFRRTMG